MEFLMPSHVFLRKLALFALISFAGVLHAGINVDRTIIDFHADQLPREDVIVSNQSDETAYVKVEILEVINPGEPNEERKVVDNLDTISFVATPAKLVIPPKGRKQVRLVNLAVSDKEKVYRINFTPVAAPLSGDEGMGVRILIAYQVLALIHPTKPVEKLEVSRKAKQLTISNTGNTYALISNMKQCDDKGKGCKDDIAGKRLYPGNSHTFELPFENTEVSYRLTNFKGAKVETVK
jgi:P pilus assembly chaperone PapD